MSTQLQPVALALTTSNQTLYTVPDNVDIAIVQFGVCNNIGADATLSVWVVPYGSVADNTNQYITAKTVSTASPSPMDAITGMSLATGDFIVAAAGTNDRLNIRLSILEVVDA